MPCLIKPRKESPNNANIAYLNFNSLRIKIIILRDICLNNSIDIFHVDKTKPDDSYPNAQFHIDVCQFLPFHRDRRKHGGGKMIFVWNGIVGKQT